MGDLLQGDDHFVCKPLSKPLKTSTLMLRSHADVHDLLSGPPPEVLAEVDAAWERAQDLFADELELSFDLDTLTRRVTGSLRVPAGGPVWERLTATETLAIACGDVGLAPAAAAHADRALAA
jgi:hypothetical protein